MLAQNMFSFDVLGGAPDIVVKISFIYTCMIRNRK